MPKPEETVERATPIVEWLRERLTLAAARGFVVGLSGGIDSAVVARLCQLASPSQVVAVVLPCHSAAADADDARLVASHFGIPIVTVLLDNAYDTLLGALHEAMGTPPEDQRAAGSEDERERIARANLKPRLRMASLYFVANSLNFLVAGTGNRSELTIGYFTKFGDGGVDLLPIGHLVKSEVRALARELDVPQSIIDRTPTAGLWIGQTDEQEMGFSYADLEAYLKGGPESVSPALALRIERLMRTSAHKKASAPVPDVN